MSSRRAVDRGARASARGAALAVGAACALLAAGCVRVPPRAQQPEPLTEAPLLAAESENAAWPAPQWWRRYGDAQLNGWVERALHEAPTLSAARARVAAAQAALDGVRAGRQLQVTAEAQQQRQRLSENGLLPTKFLGFNWYSTSDLGLDARYDLDLGDGRLAGQRAAAARASAAQAEQAAAELGLSAAIVVQYFGWQAEAAGLQLARGRLEAVDAELLLLRQRQGAELARADEALQLEQSRQQVQDALGGYDTRLQLRRVALAGLLGVAPDSLPAPPEGDLPAAGAGLPSSVRLDLIARRPDLIAARGRIAAASADLDSARAGFVPDISLHALLGLSSRDIGKLLDAGSATPLIAAAVHLPLFDAGRLRAQYAGTEASLRAAVAEYDDQLLRAAEEVNGALTERASSATKLELRARQIDTAAQLRTLTEERTRVGLTDARAQRAATRRWLEAREARLLTQYDWLSADLKLIRALGGGYGGLDGTGEQRGQ
jgi:multidrug efflux system outer membrane protein